MGDDVTQSASCLPRAHSGSPTGYIKADHATRTKRGCEVLRYLDGRLSFNTPATNNRAELSAVSAALEVLEDTAPDAMLVHFVTDSTYVIDGATKWRLGWAKKNYMRESKRGGLEPIPNREEWQVLSKQLASFKKRGVSVTFAWVKGHSNDIGNSRADYLALVGRNASTNDAAREEPNVHYWSPPAAYWVSTGNQTSPLLPPYVSECLGGLLYGFDTPYHDGTRTLTCRSIFDPTHTDAAINTVERVFRELPYLEGLSLASDQLLLPFPARDLAAFGLDALTETSQNGTEILYHGNDDRVTVFDREPYELIDREDYEWAGQALSLALEGYNAHAEGFINDTVTLVDVTDNFYDIKSKGYLFAPKKDKYRIGFNTPHGHQSRLASYVAGVNLPSVHRLVALESFKPTVYIAHVGGDYDRAQIYIITTPQGVSLTSCVKLPLL